MVLFLSEPMKYLMVASLLYQKRASSSRAIGLFSFDARITCFMSCLLIRLFIMNGQFVARGSDTTNAAGYLGLLAGDDTHPTEVAFSNLKVWSI
jgi:hypothetical protein